MIKDIEFGDTLEMAPGSDIRFTGEVKVIGSFIPDLSGVKFQNIYQIDDAGRYAYLVTWHPFMHHEDDIHHRIVRIDSEQNKVMVSESIEGQRTDLTMEECEAQEYNNTWPSYKDFYKSKLEEVKDAAHMLYEH